MIPILNNKIINYYRKQSSKHKSLDKLEEEQAFQLTDSMFDSNDKWNSLKQNAVREDERHLLDDADFNATMKLCMDDLPNQWNLALARLIIGRYRTNQNSC